MDILKMLVDKADDSIPANELLHPDSEVFKARVFLYRLAIFAGIDSNLVDSLPTWATVAHCIEMKE